MKCTGLKAVSYPDTRKQIKGSTVKIALTPVYFIPVVSCSYSINYEKISLFFSMCGNVYFSTNG